MKANLYSGFTLLELMVVVVIIGILTSVTVPGYQQSVKQSRRVDAISGLLDLQLSQARFFAEQGEYKTSFPALGGTKESYSNTYYQLKFVAADKLQWQVIATPTGSQAGDSCGVFAINQDGAVYGGKYAPQDCWGS